MENTKVILGKLKANPVFQMSLGSKELFHSNFIAWILEEPKLNTFAIEFVKQFTGINNIESIIAPKREKQNIDLQFTLNLTGGKSRLIVIENKVKSLPYQTQLDDYYNKVNNKDAKFYLLSLTKPNFEPNIWVYKSYNDLAKAMNNSINIISDEEELKIIIKYYISFIENLNLLSEDMVIDFDDEIFDYSISRYGFQEIRIHDLYLKLKYQQIADKIKEELAKEEKISQELLTNKISINSGFTNSQGLVGSFYEVSSVKYKEGEISLGIVIQLQGRQLRYVSEIHTNNINSAQEQELAYTIANKLFEENKWLLSANEIIDQKTNVFKKINQGRGREKTHNPHKFCSFNNTFIYKYDLIEERIIPVKEIVELFKNLNIYIYNNKQYFRDVLNDELQKLN